MKQRQQLGNRSCVASQVNDIPLTAYCLWSAAACGGGSAQDRPVSGADPDCADKLLRQCLVIFQANNRHRAAIQNQAFAKRGVGRQRPRPNRQNATTGVDQHQRFAGYSGKVSRQACADSVQQCRIKRHMRRRLAGHHHG